MNIRTQALLFFIMFSTYAHGAQRSTPERTIGNEEIVASFDLIRQKAIDTYEANAATIIQEGTRIYYDLTIYALNLATQHLKSVTQSTNAAVTLFGTFYNTVMKSIDHNTALLNYSPTAHAAIKNLYKQGYDLHISMLTSALTNRNVVLFFFDIHKSVIATLGQQWGFDAKIALL